MKILLCKSFFKYATVPNSLVVSLDFIISVFYLRYQFSDRFRIQQPDPKLMESLLLPLFGCK